MHNGERQLDYRLEYLNNLAEKGGPSAEDYYDLDALIADIAEHARSGRLTKQDLHHLRESLGDAASIDTMQGFAYLKPHGYAGDFELLERIYTFYVSDNSKLSNWDRYAQKQACAHAVRNRVEYFSRVLKEALSRSPAARVLNLASGPGRDMLGFFENNRDAPVHVECVDQEPKAIAYAKSLCEPHLDKIVFHNKDVLRFRSKQRFDVIWAAGVFDYFEDKVFVRMLGRLREMASSPGEIVVGNFSMIDPSKHYLDLFEWHLHRRSPQALVALARAAGCHSRQIRIEKEPTGVNLFLHIGT
jgi:SAM-dependent methyltransferase